MKDKFKPDGDGDSKEVANGGTDLANPQSDQDADLQEWKELMVRWLNKPPEQNLPSALLPTPSYIDRTLDDRARFRVRANPKLTRDNIIEVIRGRGRLFRDVFIGLDLVYVPANTFILSGFRDDLEVPVGIEEPSFHPGRDIPGGGGGINAGEDGVDLVFMPISYEEFLALVRLLFELPWLRQTDSNKIMVKTFKIRGLNRQGPMVRWDRLATFMARMERFKATINSRPEEFPNLTADMVPTLEEFPLQEDDLRYKRVEEKLDPDSKAVVFDELDTSSSMAGEPLAISKFFFFLNLIWLRSRYKTVVVIFIAHNYDAFEIKNEADFFRISDNGGTRFSSAHALVWEIYQARFSREWNAYCLHATDGYGEAATVVTEWIEKLIRGGFNYFGYLEVDPYGWSNLFTYGTSGMTAVRSVASDVEPHIGFARISNIHQVPEAMQQIFTRDKNQSGGTQ